MNKNKKIKKKYFTTAQLLNLNVQDVYKHVQKLYQHIALQNQKIKKLKLKIKKMKFLSKLDAHLLKSQDAKPIDEVKEEQASFVPSDKKEESVLDFVNEIKNTAMINAYEQAGFIYEPTSGLYWDSKSGYYYNPQCDLYYNGNDGCYYRLNPITNEFTFHSATEAAKAVKKNEKDEEEAIRKILDEGRQPAKSSQKSKDNNDSDDYRKTRRYSSSDTSSSGGSYRRRRSRSRSRSRHRSHRRRRSRSRSRREDGELDTTDSEDARREAEYRNFQKKRKKKKKGNEYEEIAKKYPPSLRLIVTESKVTKIQVGKLFMVTFKGGTLGREGSHHHVLLPVDDVSKEHLKFTYHNKKGIYQFIDRSRNGTFHNGKQVSLLKQEECEPQTLLHGDVLEIGRVKLLAHIHEGLNTCSSCEPFNYTQKPQELAETKSDEPLPASLSHKEQLKILQKRYGLESEKYQENPSGTSNKNYEDRASQRRKKVGSSHANEKTVQASVDKSIGSENKGFKMLAKMGWNEGGSIGKSDSGIKEPVQVKTQQGTTGLGHETSAMPHTFEGSKKKQEIWSKTQERYNKLKGDDDE